MDDQREVKAISLEDEPQTTFSDGNLVVTTLNATISFPLANVKKYTYVCQMSWCQVKRAQSLDGSLWEK